jgi:hypothetical protein
LNNEVDDELGIGMDYGFSNKIDEDVESSSVTENDDILLELSANETDISEDDNDMSDNESVDDEEELSFDDAANWELERLKALTGYSAFIIFANIQITRSHWSSRRLSVISNGNVILMSATPLMRNYVNNSRSPAFTLRVLRS